MIHIVVLAYNEAAMLPKLLERLNGVLVGQKESFRLLVVDDGSKDGTGDTAQALSAKYPVVVLRHAVNQGVAKAFDTGLRKAAAEAEGDDVIVTMEGDGTNDPETLPPMLEKFKEGFDVVCASRYAKGGGYRGFPLKRYLLSIGANTAARIFFRIPEVRDYTLFFKGYRASLLKRAISAYGECFVEGRGFASNAEILVKTCRGGSVRCAEVPTVYRYDLKAGKSTMKIGKNLVEYLRLFRRV